jgi:ATP-binding cassette, subfamily C, bacterial CydCD
VISATGKLWRDVTADRKGLAGTAVLGALASLSAVALIGASAWLIASAAGMPPVLTLTVAAVSVRFFALSRALLRYVERLVGHSSALRGLTKLRVSVYLKLERITPIGLRNLSRGEYLSRIGADVDSALDLPLRVVLPWVQALLVTIAIAVFTWWVLPLNGILVTILGSLALIVVPVIVRIIASRTDTRLAPARSQVVDAVVEIADNTEQILVTGSGPSALAALKQRDAKVNSLLNRQAWSIGLGNGLGTVLQGSAVIGALLIGIPAVTAGTINPVMLAVLALLPLALFEVLGTLPAAAVSWRNMSVVAQQIEDLDNIEAFPVETLSSVDGVQVRDLKTQWPNSDSVALVDVCFTVARNSHVAIVGPSGSGKSTLAYCLMGYLPFTGHIEISDSKTLLAQQSYVFDTTIRNNIQIGGGEMSDDEILRVLKRADLMEWLESQPRGVDTELGSFGNRMSGGERHRLSFARLIAADSDLVILDEPTEHLDFETAERIERDIWNSTQGVTTIMITHRLTAAQQCDQIIEFDAGRIVAIGTHEELLELGGWYAQSWKQQQEQLHMQEIIRELPVGIATNR